VHLLAVRLNRECICWQYVEFADNDACVALIQGGAAVANSSIGGTNSSIERVGLLGLLDEACRMPGMLTYAGA
jgi:myosin heavy subunit